MYDPYQGWQTSASLHVAGQRFVEGTGSDKLDLYNSYELKLEKYLHFIPFDIHNKLSKLRISSHRLQIELGRFIPFPKTPRLLRFCAECTGDHIEDEFHL